MQVLPTRERDADRGRAVDSAATSIERNVAPSDRCAGVDAGDLVMAGRKLTASIPRAPVISKKMVRTKRTYSWCLILAAACGGGGGAATLDGGGDDAGSGSGTHHPDAGVPPDAPPDAGPTYDGMYNGPTDGNRCSESGWCPVEPAIPATLRGMSGVDSNDVCHRRTSGPRAATACSITGTARRGRGCRAACRRRSTRSRTSARSCSALPTTARSCMVPEARDGVAPRPALMNATDAQLANRGTLVGEWAWTRGWNHRASL